MNIFILSLFIPFHFVLPARTRLDTFTDSITTCPLFACVNVFKCPKIANGITQLSNCIRKKMFERHVSVFLTRKKWDIASNEVMKNASKPESTLSTITITIITETRKCNFNQNEKAQLYN